MEGRLNDRVAIVTGAASGIGRAITLRFLEEGARVFAVDRNPDTLAQLADTPGRMERYLADISGEGASAAVVAACIAAFGKLDLLVNNAGLGNSKPAHDTTDEDFDRWVAINLTSGFRLSRDALPHLRHKGGAILNIASTLGLMGWAGQAAYTAGKAGVIGLTRQMAAEYGPNGLRVNAIAPGVVETPATIDRLRNNAAYRAANTGSTPLGRAGQPAEIAAAAAFLCSDDASFITGHVLVVDGGLSSTCHRQ
jgi:NAD(P)-dependent dehydrogenase (short-subunit alcohol dehydrogenase family)